jgi:hypothetical protein
MSAFDLYEPVSKLFYPILHKLFHITPQGCFVVITGFTCGYPMGIKTASFLYSSGKISYREYLYLISFTNNVGIGFLFGFVYNKVMSRSISPLFLLGISYIPSLITAFLLREKSDYYDTPLTSLKLQQVKKTNPAFDSIKSISVIIFYLIIFSVISDYFSAFIPDYLMGKQTIITLIEITKGFSKITDCTLSSKLFLTITGIATGGLCITVQSLSFINDRKAKLRYLKGKLISLLISYCIIIIYLSLSQ